MAEELSRRISIGTSMTIVSWKKLKFDRLPLVVLVGSKSGG
jgi:hypothetical protein